MGAQRGTRVVAGAANIALPLVVATLLVGLGLTLWGRGDLNGLICDGDCGPSNVIAPEALSLRDQPVVAGPDAGHPGAIDPAKVEAAVRRQLDDPALGPRVGFAAVGPGSEKIATRGGGAYAPASTTKVLTSFAALATIDPDTRFTTKVVRSGGGVVLVGGGDPYLSTKPARRTADRVFNADLTTLARRTAAKLEKAGTTKVTVGHDASLFTGPSASPAWESSYVSANIVTPVSALWVDKGITGGLRARDPAADAARTFARLLAERGITVTGDPAAVATGRGAEVLARVRSATLAQIVETLVRISDNEAAEVVLRHVAIAAGRSADFKGGTTAVRAALESAGISTKGLVLGDGSGLSRGNRVSPTTMVEVLRQALSAPRTSELLADLPVGGFTGTLVDRFATMPAARGTVRAKTGTLTGIHSLAGYATDADGRPVLFALMADRSAKAQPLQAQAALDRAAAAIAACSCGG